MSGKKIPLVCLKPGHHYTNVNQSPDGTYFEWKRNQVVMDLAHEMFKCIPGIDSFVTKTADELTTLQGEVRKAVDAGADIYISKHSNARGSGAWNDANGFSVYIYPGRADSLALARIAIKYDAELLPMKNLGIKTANLYETRVPPMPAILYETGYHTNKGDVEKLKSHEFRVLEARAIVKTACEYFNVKYVEDDNVMAAKQHIVAPGETMYRISRNYDLALNDLAACNPHIEDLALIHPGDIIFLEQPNTFEVKYAALNRELVLCKKSSGEIEQLKIDLKEAQKEINARIAENNRMLNDIRVAQSAFFKYV